MPVLEGNIEGIRMMQHFGADYSTLNHRGSTAFDIARQSGNKAMIEALGRKQTSL